MAATNKKTVVKKSKSNVSATSALGKKPSAFSARKGFVVAGLIAIVGLIAVAFSFAGTKYVSPTRVSCSPGFATQSTAISSSQKVRKYRCVKKSSGGALIVSKPSLKCPSGFLPRGLTGGWATCALNTKVPSSAYLYAKPTKLSCGSTAFALKGVPISAATKILQYSCQNRASGAYTKPPFWACPAGYNTYIGKPGWQWCAKRRTS